MARMKPLIFVVGHSRFCLTMLRRILDLNSEFHIFGELHFLEQLVVLEEFSVNQRCSWDKASSVMGNLLIHFFAPAEAV